MTQKIAKVAETEITEKEYNQAINDENEYVVELVDRAFALLASRIPEALLSEGESCARIHYVLLWWRKLVLKENDFLTSDEYCPKVVGEIDIENLVKKHL